MYSKLVKKAFKEFSNVKGVDYAIINTDSYGDCNTCVNASLVDDFGEESKGIFLKHWRKGMNAGPSISKLDELYIAHDITEEQGEKLHNILSKYFIVEPEKYNNSKAFVISSKATTLEDKIKEVVETEYKDMKLSKKYSNRVRLSDKCQKVISKELNLSGANIEKLIDKHVEEIIPEELD